ncbi:MULTISPECIES: hypothetical protein [unclassified Cyanobium]|jgi:hypothetical protein|nr:MULTISPECIES: hypothetical protein [unclassified Cyanobium]
MEKSPEVYQLERMLEVDRRVAMAAILHRFAREIHAGLKGLDLT